MRTFGLVPLRAAAMAFPRYHLNINSTELAERLIRQESVLIVPGDRFGLDHYLRMSIGPPPEYIQARPDHIHELATELQG